MHSRWARVARGITAAAFATFVAAFSHTTAGGVSPSAFGVGASFVLSAMVCTVLAGRTLSLWRLTAALGLSQFLFHGLFSGVGTPVVVEHHMSTMGMVAPEHSDGSMWLAHAVAAGASVVAFRFGERAFWGIGDTARLLFARLVVVAIPALEVPRPVVVVEHRFLPRDLALLLSSMRHRGPPAELTA